MDRVHPTDRNLWLRFTAGTERPVHQLRGLERRMWLLWNFTARIRRQLFAPGCQRQLRCLPLTTVEVFKNHFEPVRRILTIDRRHFVFLANIGDISALMVWYSSALVLTRLAPNLQGIHIALNVGVPWVFVASTLYFRSVLQLILWNEVTTFWNETIHLWTFERHLSTVRNDWIRFLQADRWLRCDYRPDLLSDRLVESTRFLVDSFQRTFLEEFVC